MTLKDYLTDKNIQAFSQDIGANLVTVYRWVNGETIPSAVYMKRIMFLTKGEVRANDFYS